MYPHNPWEHNLSLRITKTSRGLALNFERKMTLKPVRLFHINAGLLFFFFFFFTTYKWMLFFTSYTWIPWFPSSVFKKVNKSGVKAGRCCSAPSTIAGCALELRMELSASANGHWSVYEAKNLARDEISMHQPEKILFCLGGVFGHFCLSFPLDGFLSLCQLT